MKAAFFVIATAAPVRVMTARDPANFNTALKTGQTWREIETSINDFSDIPALETLEAHPDLVEPA